MTPKTTVAIIQYAPEYLNTQASLPKIRSLAEKASNQKAQLVVFGETWLCGYPAWLDHCPYVARWNHQPVKEVYIKMHQEAITVPGPEIDFLSKLTQELGIYLMIGVNERVLNGPGNGTIYNSLLTFDSQGKLCNHHRKLMPTFTEKLLYGVGDGNGLKTVDTPFGQLGGLICWEHWMPHARQALHNAGEHIHVAVWPTVHDMHQIASRHYAFEGRCFVLAAGQLMKVSDIPNGLELPSDLKNKGDEWLLRGGSAIIGPDGKYVVEPVFDQEEIIIAELDMNLPIGEKMTLDVTGHYQRPDVFSFEVNSERR